MSIRFVLSVRSVIFLKTIFNRCEDEVKKNSVFGYESKSIQGGLVFSISS